jgi:hypothetical protein
MGATAKPIIKDPENFHILTADMKKTIIKAAINKVNIQAARTRTKAVQNIKADFTIRNTFTARQVQYTQMPQGRYSLSKIQSTVGITEKASYMARQELGGIRRPAIGKTLAIPTVAARGGNNASLVLRQNYISRLRKKTVKGGNYSRKGGTYRSKLVARAYVAYKHDLFMRFTDKLFKVTGFRKSSEGVSFLLHQIYGFDKKTTVTRPQPWLKPASEAVARQGERIFINEMHKLGL